MSMSYSMSIYTHTLLNQSNFNKFTYHYVPGDSFNNEQNIAGY